MVADRGYAIPGTVLVNGDFHTCAAGAFNCAARGVGGPDTLYAITMGKAWFRVGETIRYDFAGALRPGVSAKDIFLFIAGTYGAHVNQNVEYGGPGMGTMSMNGRRTLATMGAELFGGIHDIRAGRPAERLHAPGQPFGRHASDHAGSRPRLPGAPRHRSRHAGAVGRAAGCGGQQLGARSGRSPASTSIRRSSVPAPTERSTTSLSWRMW